MGSQYDLRPRDWRSRRRRDVGRALLVMLAIEIGIALLLIVAISGLAGGSWPGPTAASGVGLLLALVGFALMLRIYWRYRP